MPSKSEFEVSLYKYRARCLEVTDGDTMKLLVDHGLDEFRKLKVRLYGINTPETYGVPKDSAEYQAGMKAKLRVIELMRPSYNPEAQVQLWIETLKDNTEKYGRYLAKVWFDLQTPTGVVFTQLNELLVTEGLAIQRSY
jgi:micrococcal nuclease